MIIFSFVMYWLLREMICRTCPCTIAGSHTLRLCATVHVEIYLVGAMGIQQVLE